MERIWVPKLKPPRSSEVKKLSSLTQRIIEVLVNENIEKKEKLYWTLRPAMPNDVFLPICEVEFEGRTKSNDAVFMNSDSQVPDLNETIRSNLSFEENRNNSPAVFGLSKHQEVNKVNEHWAEFQTNVKDTSETIVDQPMNDFEPFVLRSVGLPVIRKPYKKTLPGLAKTTPLKRQARQKTVDDYFKSKKPFTESFKGVLKKPMVNKDPITESLNGVIQKSTEQESVNSSFKNPMDIIIVPATPDDWSPDFDEIELDKLCSYVEYGPEPVILDENEKREKVLACGKIIPETPETLDGSLVVSLNGTSKESEKVETGETVKVQEIMQKEIINEKGSGENKTELVSNVVVEEKIEVFDIFKKPIGGVVKKKSKVSVERKTKILQPVEKTNENVAKVTQRKIPMMKVRKTVDKSKLAVRLITKTKAANDSTTPVPPVPVVDLNDYSVRDMGSQIVYSPPEEVAMTLVFRQGDCQLNRADNSKCQPEGILLRIAWEAGNVEYCYLNTTTLQTKDNSRKFFESLLQCCSIIACGAQEILSYVCHVFKFSRKETSEWRVLDVLVAQWLIDSDNPCSNLDEVAVTLKIHKDWKAISDTRGKFVKLLDLLSKTYSVLRQQLQEKDLWGLYLKMEVRITLILALMEHGGIQVDKSKLDEFGAALDKQLKELEAQAYKAAGRNFQIKSPVQLRKILYDELKLDVKFNVQVKETVSLGAKSTSESVLHVLEPLHPLPGIVLEYRRLQKVKSTYVDGILNCVHKGKIKCTWDQTAAATGRITALQPNLQAIPKQSIFLDTQQGTKLEINLRKAFVARQGYTFVSADFQHIEFRIFAHLSEDARLLELFHTPGDIFTGLARMWLGDNGRTTEQEDRDKTKKVVYAVMYGAGAAKLGELLHVTKDRAAAIIKVFTGMFPGLKRYTARVTERCRKDGYLTTPDGRRRNFPGIADAHFAVRAQAERQALNFLTQGSAADICKMAMLVTEQKFSQHPELDVRLVLQIHDELLWEVLETQLDIVTEMLDTAPTSLVSVLPNRLPWEASVTSDTS